MSDEAKDRQLRALYRQHKPAVRWNADKMIIDQAQQAEQWRIVRTEFERLYGRPSARGELERILTTVWTEGRELAGQTYDYARQAWIGPDGERAID